MIYTDQLGYLKNASKIAVSTAPCNFQIIRVSDRRSVFDGVASTAIADENSRETVYQIDFSEVTEEGEYYILAGNNTKSHNFRIGNDIYRNLQNSLVKALYFQRCGCSLTEPYAGIHTHKACHTDSVIFYDDRNKPIDSVKKFDITGGWHDAGDFGRYTSPGAVAVAHLLYAYELFPETFKDSLNIPESGNGIPDVLNECLYELRWLLKMQRDDGSVYHKLTAYRHCDFVMPEDDHDRFLIYPVSSVATADFVAVMALACRVFKDILPDFSQEAKEAAIKGTVWLSQNPYIGFKNPAGSNTGEYSDPSDLDERLWAAAEMLRIDHAHRNDYIKVIRDITSDKSVEIDFGWAEVAGLAALSILTDSDHNIGTAEAECRRSVLCEASKTASLIDAGGFKVAMAPDDFIWGSNMVVSNRGILFMLASMLSEGAVKDKYTASSLEQLHYLLGRNALDISYVTGYGTNSFKHPHNRPTAVKGGEVMKGWVSGGPFRFFCDIAAKDAIPEGTAPMKCYLDDIGSYSTNEITIYWNSSLALVCAFINSLTC